MNRYHTITRPVLTAEWTLNGANGSQIQIIFSFLSLSLEVRNWQFLLDYFSIIAYVIAYENSKSLLII